jgi:HK97 family phage major capsid protein
VDGGTSPPTVFGYPIMQNNAMPQMGANANSILFGHFGMGYTIRLARRQLVVSRLDEHSGDALHSAFIAHASMDGIVDDPAAIKAYRQSAT